MKAVKEHSQPDIHCHLGEEKDEKLQARDSVGVLGRVMILKTKNDGGGCVFGPSALDRCTVFLPFWSYKNVLFVAVEVFYYGNLV